jgi:DMSO/TMAO reductase YedYZ molybdopterin-dependent catalytic subunit
MLKRFVNTALLVVMVLLFVTGIVMLYGTWWPWVFDLHHVAGWMLVALLPWKGRAAYQSLKRRLRKDDREWGGLLISVLFASLTLLDVVLALLWMWRLGPERLWLGQTVIVWHWMVGLGLIPLFGLHLWTRWPRPRAVDLMGRRRTLKVLLLGATGFLGRWAGKALARARQTPERPREPTTGMRGYGHFTGNAFPVTGEAVQAPAIESWRLVVTGALPQALTLTYDDLLSLPSEQWTEKLDCTTGWYTLQHWQGVPLTRLLREAAAAETIVGVRLISFTGYNHTFSTGELSRILLATHVGGEVLSPGHGFPLRVVVPERRGWFWVKWLTQVEVLDNPLEVIGRVLYAPREILRQW